MEGELMIMVATIKSGRIDTALLVLRIVTGIVFVAHGWQKLFVAGIGPTVDFFAQAGIPLAGFTAPVVAALELVGGVALMLGVFTRPFAFMLAINMLGAIGFVHIQNGFFLPGGIEFALTLLSAMIALALAGGGEASVDQSVKRRTAVVMADSDWTAAREERKTGATV
jgi:putative oxidoreductase